MFGVQCVGVLGGCWVVRELSLWVLHGISSSSVSFTSLLPFLTILLTTLIVSFRLFLPPPHSSLLPSSLPSSLPGTKHRPRIFLRPVPPRSAWYHPRRHRAAHRHQPRLRYERIRGPTGASAHQRCGRPCPRGVPGAGARECVLKRLGRRRRSDPYGRCERHHRCGGERHFGQRRRR